MWLFKVPKISFVVIAYNRAEYIRECMDSILTQDIDKEVICIDDCSTDGTFEILNEYKRKNKCVRVYQNEEHLGTCLTRITGLSHCKGEFALQIDADDRLFPDSMQRIYQDAMKTGADIVEFRNASNGDVSYQKYISDASEVLSGDLIRYYAGESGNKISNTLCNKLVTKKVYRDSLPKMNKDLRQSNYSDVVYILWHFLKTAKTFSFSDVFGYFYYCDRGMTRLLPEVERLKNYCGFAITKVELESVYGRSEALNRKWNTVCNQAALSFLNLPENERDNNWYLLDELMSRQDSQFLIQAAKANSKISAIGS